MSTRFSLSFKGLAATLGGFFLAATGLLLVINTRATEAGSVDLWLFTPLGIGMALVGAMMLASRDT